MTWTHVGNVYVDSGRIVIADPCYAENEDEYGVIVVPPEGDGVYPVFLCMENGQPVTVMIRFDRISDEAQL